VARARAARHRAPPPRAARRPAPPPPARARSWDAFLLSSLVQPQALWHGGRDTLKFLVSLELL